MSGYPPSRLLALSVLAFLSGCGGGNNGTTPPPTTAIARSPTSSGDAQSGTVGQPLANPIQVVVTDGGAPSSGTTVSWSTSAQGGALDPATSATDANGLASSAWKLGNTAGSQTAQATLAGASGSPVSFSATAAAGPATTLAKTQTGNGDNQTAELNTQLAAPLKARATDQFGNAVQGVAVGWAGTGGAVAAASVPTDASGVSAVDVTAGGAAGPIVITATADGLDGSPLTFNGMAVVPVPAAPTASVTVGNIFFRSNHNTTANPAVDTVAVGGKVTWTWVSTGTTPHSVQATGVPAFTSSTLLTGNGQSYDFTFMTAGTYTYTCNEHPGQMTGRIVVK